MEAPQIDGERGVLVGVTLEPLRTGNMLTPDELTQIIGDLQMPATTPQAIKQLQDRPPDPRRQAEIARLLEKVATNGSFDLIVRNEAVTALRWWGTPESVEPLAKLLRETDAHAIHKRHAALETMAYLGGEKAIALIVGQMDELLDRNLVVKMLQGMGSATESQVLALLSHKDIAVRVDAAKILKTIGTKASIPVGRARLKLTGIWECAG